jgi:phenylalanyl-tRNA synthetase beta chain
MRVSLNWVAELLSEVSPSALRARADELASRLTFAGLEVERQERIGEALGPIVIAKISSVAAHSGANRLSVVQLEVGTERIQVVSGATNFKAGDLVPLARAGTRLPSGMLIESAELRGVPSQGMLCSEAELGVTDDHGGVWILPNGLRAGALLTDELPLADIVFDVNVTPNRGDCLSHLGIARELAALFGLSLRNPEPAPPAQPDADLDGISMPPPPRIEALERCGRYEGQLIVGKAGLQRRSPFLWRYRLQACGVRAIGVAVDVTNYVLLELGQPLHAFDRQKLRAGITVRLARPGERLVTLDGVERTLDASDLCICDGAAGERIVALAGVMGGAETAVGEGTQALYLEAAHFAAAGVRHTARRHAIESEAAYRFARGVDPLLPARARERAARLLEQAGAIAGPWSGADGKPHAPVRVDLHFPRVEEVLGEGVSADEARATLERLKITSAGSGAGDKGSYLIPSHRPDLEAEVDLIAEIGRVRGFDRLPGRPPLEAPAVVPRDRRLERLGILREALRGQGFAETMHLGFLHDPVFEALGEGEAVRVVNPLASESSVMRRSLLPSLLHTARRNLAHLTQDAGVGPALRFFEIARTYRWPREGERGEGPAMETLTLGLVASGSRAPLGWSNVRADVDFYELRGTLERLFEAVGLEAKDGVDVRPLAHPALHPRSASAVFLGTHRLGIAGELHPGLSELAGLPRGVFVSELFLDPLLTREHRTSFRPVPRYPAVLRDVALVVEDSVPAAALDAVLRRAGGQILESLVCFDVYRGPPLKSGQKSLAYSLRFRDPERTLTDDEVAAVHRAMVDAAKKELKATLR